MSAEIQGHDMTNSTSVLALLALMGTSYMSDELPHRSLQLEITEAGNDTVEVLLTGHSLQAQRVSYELKTSGASTSAHKGTTSLRAMEPTILSTIRFSGSKKWCVSLSVEEGNGEHYTITEGSGCK